MSPISRRQDISQPSLQAFETGAETGKSGVRAKGVGNEATPSPTLLESPPRCSRAHFFPLFGSIFDSKSLRSWSFLQSILLEVSAHHADHYS